MSTIQGGLSPRAAHTAVYINETDSLYVFGGYDLNNVLGALQIYRFNKSAWEDEWGISLRSRHFPSKIDNTLLKAVLHQDDDEAHLFGIGKDASIFRNILLSISSGDHSPLSQRKQRSPRRNETSPHALTNFLEELNDKPRPKERYGHAMSRVVGGFVVYGGKLADGSLSNELWLYNVTLNGGQWSLRANASNVRPPPLTRHTLTLADDYLYVFGGSLQNGEFSSR